ncbi:MAG: hypothetical protein II601_02455 [Lachnospiraceae bacterium]|nr:hypothetical protein [Lachnospiraceae bacterium]
MEVYNNYPTVFMSGLGGWGEDQLQNKIMPYWGKGKNNVLEDLRGLGYECPVVSVTCASEVLSPKIQETVDAAALKEAALAGEFGKCIVEGPISLDLSVNKESAAHKHYDSPAAGEADILLVPNITAGNMFVKGLLEFAGAKMAGLVVGAKCPIALNSRSATDEEKYAALMAAAGMIPEE